MALSITSSGVAPDLWRFCWRRAPQRVGLARAMSASLSGLSGMFENGVRRGRPIVAEADQRAFRGQRHALSMFVYEVTKQRPAAEPGSAGIAFAIMVGLRAFR
jgi:hypothetical protein